MIIRKFLLGFLNGSKRPRANDVTKGSVRSHHLDILPATAQQFERQCVLLKRTGTDIAAVWGGDGIVPPPSGPYRHWISVDSSYLQSEFGSNGVLSVYTNEEDCASGITVFSQAATLTEEKGEYLYAHVTRSIPPPNASRDLENEAYTEQWMHNCPIYNDKDVVAVLGGWHFPWPDDDWDELRDRDLLVWTIEGSEPWVEVWRSDEATTVMQRIT
ncbi:hypothetical protein ACO0K9_09290 [Undibacterium sp. Ji50W]|uniref:hypothetical protein n=1 Tax=Undibacterium sp. Ji50W TaxID=3413041 RepID=UPI003BF1AE21